MKRIIFTRPDGGLSVVTPVEGARLAFTVTLADGKRCVADEKSAKQGAPVDQIFRRWPVAGAVAEWAETEEQFLARVIAKSVPADAQYVTTVDESAIPHDRTYRNAWENSNGSVRVSMPKAREIHRERMRIARKPKLEALDIMQLRGVDVEAQKNLLRDVTALPEIESAATIAELKAVWPEILTK